MKYITKCIKKNTFNKYRGTHRRNQVESLDNKQSLDNKDSSTKLQGRDSITADEMDSKSATIGIFLEHFKKSCKLLIKALLQKGTVGDHDYD